MGLWRVSDSSIFYPFLDRYYSRAKGTGTPHVDPHILWNYQLPIPPLFEQNRIVAKIEELFSELDQGIESLKKAQEQLKIYREAVLKHAFEGKLTEKWRRQQLSEGKKERAESLLEKIKQERERLYLKQLDEWEQSVKAWEANGNEGKKPAKPKKYTKLRLLNENELSILLSIPDDWNWCKLNDLADKITDGEHSTPRRTAQGYYLLSARNVQNGYISLEKMDYIPKDEYERIIKRCYPQENDILISCSGTIGRVCRVPANLKFTMVRSVALVKIQSNQYLSKYLEYQLLAPFLQKIIHSKKKATAQANLFLEPISELPIALASIEEKKKIIEEIESRLSICDQL